MREQEEEEEEEEDEAVFIRDSITNGGAGRLSLFVIQSQRRRGGCLSS